MADHSRVARWRQRLRDEGKKSMTVWLSVEDELRLKDLAVQWHTSPSEIMRHALAQFQPGRPPSLSNATASAQPQHSYDTDTSQIRVWLQAELPGMVRHIVEDMAVEMLPPHPRHSGVTDDIQCQDRYVTDTIQPQRSDVSDSTTPSQRTGGRPRSALGQRILDLLGQHPEGLTVEQIRATLEPSRPLGDILGGMRRTGAVQTHREGRGLRYTLPG